MKFKNVIVVFAFPAMKRTRLNNMVGQALFCFMVASLFPFFTLNAQQHKIDSLITVLRAAKDDTNKVKTLNALSASYYSSIPDSTIAISRRTVKLAASLGWQRGEANAYSNAGTGYRVKSDYSNALPNFLKALEIAENMESKQLQVDALVDIGLVYTEQADYTKALDYDLRALKMAEENKYKRAEANVLGNIGGVFYEQGDYPKALDFYQKAFKMAQELGNKQLQAKNLCNVGVVCKEEAGSSSIDKGTRDSLYNKALRSYEEALKMAEELGNKRSQTINLGNIGDLYTAQQSYTKALDYYSRALKMSEEIGYKRGIANHLGSIGALYFKTKKYSDAELYYKKAIALDSAIGDQNDLRIYEENLSQLYDSTGRFKLALDYYRKATALKDTLFNLDKNKILTSKELSFQYEKKEALDRAEQSKKDALAESDKRKQGIIKWAVIGGLLLTLVFAGLILRSLLLTNRQKQVIQEKNRDILDSINYAQRIQQALLKEELHQSARLPEHFILFKPKDIVSGDFYWSFEKQEYLYMAAVDCTGHGVPGGFLSMLGVAFLNELTAGSELLTPAEILEKLREKILKELKQTGANDETRDGMDISLVRMNLDTKEIHWSGANNSLYIVPPPLWGDKAVLNEITPDKQPIGYYPAMKPFTNHIITFSPLRGNTGGCLYLLTDGYADQFGGAKGKKFKYSQLKEKLLAISHLPMTEQKAMLNDDFEQWKSGMEQTDDVCIIGIRL